MYKLYVYVPTEYKERVKEALFSAGAGVLGNYDCCSWEVRGCGQFRPGSGSAPFLGETDRLEVVEEYRVETLVAQEHVATVMEALFESHPYEEPAYEFVRILQKDDLIQE
ncbi:hypothetical protein [Chitinivibrio alkaliphilus]|uniref:NGG1p interacting factor NIF3 n=1 Tax=Chitinivibrio alkaliphilus ACht1 TaxID=1313304 RepID=U7D7K5_9BACT|nr:hypothetical protein [Chitinivibrio alkaliphilus]ERP31913.1 hypothetical protein CALK_1129 [Chitinivibrio alkaliphilus ACht1]